MVFSAKDENILLISDHIPLNQVSSFINSEVIIEKVSDSILYFKKFFTSIKEVFISGLNPHAGENGLWEMKKPKFVTQSKAQTHPLIILKACRWWNYLKNEKEPHQLYVYIPRSRLSLSKVWFNRPMWPLAPFSRIVLTMEQVLKFMGKKQATGCYHLLQKSLKDPKNLL